jgi:hypothetical protein
MVENRNYSRKGAKNASFGIVLFFAAFASWREIFRLPVVALFLMWSIHSRYLHRVNQFAQPLCETIT